MKIRTFKRKNKSLSIQKQSSLNQLINSAGGEELTALLEKKLLEKDWSVERLAEMRKLGCLYCRERYSFIAGIWTNMTF